MPTRGYEQGATVRSLELGFDLARVAPFGAFVVNPDDLTTFADAIGFDLVRGSGGGGGGGDDG